MQSINRCKLFGIFIDDVREVLRVEGRNESLIDFSKWAKEADCDMGETGFSFWLYSNQL